MKRKVVLKNLIYAFGAQGISLIMSFIMSLVVPKVLGIREYSYWQLFLFYVGYVGFFHFGFNDGLYLRLGGKEYEDLDKKTISTEIKCMMLIQLVISSIFIIVVNIIDINSDRKFVLICTAIYLLFTNLANCIGYIFQAVNQTSVFSIATMIDRITFIVLIVSMLVFKVTKYEYFIAGYMFTKFCALSYSLFKGREVFFARCGNVKKSLKEMKIDISVGIKLMIANIASTLVLGIGRQIIDMRWGVETFGCFSFSMSMTSFFLVFISQASMVLFPALRQSKEKEVKSFYKNIKMCLEIILPVTYLLYNPINMLLGMWLPQYKVSLKMLILLLPVCMFDGKMNLLGSTYLKVFRKEKQLLKINLVTVLLSVILSTISAYAIGSLYLVVVSMVIAIMFRSIITEFYLAKMMDINVRKDIVLEVLVSVIFMVGTWFTNSMLALLINLVSYCAYLFIKRDSSIMVVRKIRRILIKLRRRKLKVEI